MTGAAPADAVTVRHLTLHDATWSAQLHKRALSVGLFPSLGARFLRRYHRSFIESPFAVALVACADGAPVGFVVGVLHPAAHRRETVRRHGMGLALLGLPSILTRPTVLARFVRTRAGPYARGLWRQLRPAPAVARVEKPSRVAVLSHIAIEDSLRGQGVGSTLVDAFVCAAADEGSSIVQTSTVDRSTFYESLGWTAVGSGRTFDGATQHRLMRRIDTEAAENARDLSERPPNFGTTVVESP